MYQCLDFKHSYKSRNLRGSLEATDPFQMFLYSLQGTWSHLLGVCWAQRTFLAVPPATLGPHTCCSGNPKTLDYLAGFLVGSIVHEMAGQKRENAKLLVYTSMKFFWCIYASPELGMQETQSYSLDLYALYGIMYIHVLGQNGQVTMLSGSSTIM
jgi:hypothetical protein